MLPDFLAGSYKRYKQDTALFTTWLANAAASCGYKPEATKRQDSEQPVPINPSAPIGCSQIPKSASPEPALLSTGRLKGRERKAAKDAADKAKKVSDDTSETQAPSTVKYTITTAELLRQAEAVTKSRARSRVQMPASLRAVVERAIRARQRCSEWFQKSEVHNKYADKQHTHFIEILKQSLKILEPCVEAAEGPAKTQGKRAEPSVEGSASITNRFAALMVEDPLNVDPSDVSEVAAAVNVAQKTKPSKDGPVISAYELEDEDEFDEELAFIIFCFFEDLHRTQDFIDELWRKYKARKCDLHTAAITTNAAFDLVRQAEEDLIAQAPKLFNRKRSWDSIAIIIFYADAFQQCVCPEARLNSNETLRITPFDDFIYLSTARILMKFTFLADVPKGCELPYPVPCPPLRFGYVARPELLGTPEMDRKEQEDLTLSRFIIDRQIWSTCREIGGGVFTPPPLEDEFSESLSRLTKEGVLSVALVFEAQVFLDIQDIMGDDVRRGHQDLLRTTNKIDKIMNLKAVDGMWDVGGTGERWHERDVDAVLRIKMTSMYWILDTPANAFPKIKEQHLAASASENEEVVDLGSGTSSQHRPPPQQAGIPESSEPEKLRDSVRRSLRNPKFSTVSMNVHRVPEGTDVRDPEVQRLLRKHLVATGQLPDERPVDPKHDETARNLNLKLIEPSKDLNFLFTTNPIYCGLVSFSILTDFEAAGISLCNWHKSIWPTAHLYNALQQTSSISKTWPEMEELTDLHMDALFAGHLPLSAYEFFIRFALALGLSTSNFSRNPRTRTNNDRIRFRQGANGTKLKVTEMSSIFRQYFEKKSSLETCLVKMDSLIRGSGPRGSRKERDARKRPLTNLQFLAMLEANLPQVTQRLRFDYITLTKQCVKLLKTIRQQLELQFQVAYPRIPTEDSADQTLTWVVMQILEENNELVSARERDPRGAPAPLVGQQFRVAGEEMQKFLGTYRPRDLTSNFNALPRPARAPSGLVPNHWNISIRHVALSPPGDLVLLVQPDSQFVHTEGPIQIVEGQTPGHTLNPKSLVTLQTIARLIMKAFVEAMSGPSFIAASAPWSWATNDPNFARRIMKVMTDMGVREDLLNMAVADVEELKHCNEAWERFTRKLTGFVRPSAGS